MAITKKITHTCDVCGKQSVKVTDTSYGGEDTPDKWFNAFCYEHKDSGPYSLSGIQQGTVCSVKCLTTWAKSVPAQFKKERLARQAANSAH